MLVIAYLCHQNTQKTAEIVLSIDTVSDDLKMQKLNLMVQVPSWKLDLQLLLGPADFGDVVVLREIIQVFIEFHDAFLVRF